MSTLTTPAPAPETSTDAHAPDRFAARDANPLLADRSHLSQDQQDFLFEVNGFQVLHQVIEPDHLQQINDWIDSHDLDALQPGDWVGNAEVHRYGSKDGLNFQNVMTGGEPFTKLIDHPGWVDRARRYIEGGAHRLAIDETFLNIRNSGGFIPIHSGGAIRRFTANFRHATTGEWFVGQINVLMALTDVGPGDGATTVIPGSHKSAMQFPEHERAWEGGNEISGADQPGMVEVHLRAGDALMFTDAICHGSTPRTNPGQRRVCIYRYAPHLLAPRMNYVPDPQWIATLSETQRDLVMPTPPRMRPGQVLRAEDFEHDPVGN